MFRSKEGEVIFKNLERLIKISKTYKLTYLVYVTEINNIILSGEATFGRSNVGRYRTASLVLDNFEISFRF